MYGNTKLIMKKILFFIVILLITTGSVFSTGKEKEKNKETKTEKTEKVSNEKVSEKILSDETMKDDIRNSVLEFLKDVKINPDSTYVPFKKR